MPIDVSDSSEVRTRGRALSHKDYLDTLQRPSGAEVRRISEIQTRKEGEIERKYHTAQEHDAVTRIQKVYRGHRDRRQLQGLTLHPSSRWTELIREWRYRGATAAAYGPGSPQSSSAGRPRAPSDVAKLNWQRVCQVAERVGAGETSPSRPESNEHENAVSNGALAGAPQGPLTLLMDARYFLELVDSQHRYGTNLQVYHGEWLRSKAHESFFRWLDEGEGRHLDLTGCSRAKLDRERIRYLSKDERMDYLVSIDDEGKLRWQKSNKLITTSAERYKDSMHGIVPKESEGCSVFNDEEVVRQLSDSRRFARQIARARVHQEELSGCSSESSCDEKDILVRGTEQTIDSQKVKKTKKHFHVSPATVLNHLLRASIKPGTWIYVADTVGRLYVGIKSSGAFQHTSFLSGARISSAGLIGIVDGQLTYLSPLSGHYRPTTKSFKAFVKSLDEQGVDLSQLKVSRAFEVLLGMGYYAKTKEGVHKVVHGDKDGDDRRSKSSGSDEASCLPLESSTATDVVEQRWQQEHQHGLSRLLADLRIGRRSSHRGATER